MAKMKWDNDIEWRELNDAAYEEDGEDFTYEGPTPPANIILAGHITKMWATETSNGDQMIKALFVTEDEGEKKQYNGCPFWENVLFTMPQMKWKWQPWLDALGITLADLKNKTVVDDDETRLGFLIERIGKIKFDKPFPCRIKTSVERSAEYGVQARIGKFLPASVEDAEDDEFEDEDDNPF